jgi:uncharacterized protein YaaN involved in tellurite resistance
VSDTPTAVEDRLSVPGIEDLRADLDMSLPATVDAGAGAGAEPKLDKQADDLIDRLLSLDPDNETGRDEARAAVESMGLGAQRDAARRSQMLKEPLRTLSTRAEDGGDVAKSLIDLRVKVEDLDPGGMDFDQGWFMRLIGNIPGIGTPMKRYFSRYENAEPVIDAIIRSLNNGKDQLKRDNLTLDEDQKHMRQAGMTLEQAIKLGQVIDTKLEYKLSREIPSDDPRVKFVQEDLLFPLRQRIQDLQQQLLVNQQGYLTIEMIIRNNRELMRGVDRAVSVTVNALQVAVTLAMALAHQKVTLEKIQAVTQTTNSLLAGTAKRLKTQGAEIQKQAASTALDMDVLRQSFADINEALEDVSRYRQEALPMMASNILEMDEMSAKAEDAIQRAEKSRKVGSNLSIEVLDDL